MRAGDPIMFSGYTFIPERKVVQIATLPNGPLNNATVLALCDDGTMWQITHLDDGWKVLRDIPQPEPAAPSPTPANPNRPIEAP